MSSIDELRLRWFYRRRIVPVARQLSERGVTLMPMGPEPEVDSWYIDFPEGEPELIQVGTDSLGGLEQLWSDGSLPELRELIEPLARLQQSLKTEPKETSEVSPFIYVMY